MVAIALLGLCPGSAAGAGLATGMAAVTIALVNAADILYFDDPLDPALEADDVVEECV